MFQDSFTWRILMQDLLRPLWEGARSSDGGGSGGRGRGLGLSPGSSRKGQLR